MFTAKLNYTRIWNAIDYEDVTHNTFKIGGEFHAFHNFTSM